LTFMSSIIINIITSYAPLDIRDKFIDLAEHYFPVCKIVNLINLSQLNMFHTVSEYLISSFLLCIIGASL
jgi:hypothetical protein